MILRFFLAFFRKHRFYTFRIMVILFLTSTAFLLSAAITSFADSQIQQETRVLLGADITLESSTPPTSDQLQVLSQLSEIFEVQIASSIDFQTNLMLDSEEILLSDIKVVSDNYPLVGPSIDRSTTGVYISDALASVLQPGEMIQIGDTSYDVNGKISEGGFTGFSLFTEGREVWIPEEGASLENLLGIGARVEYEYFIVSDDADPGVIRDFLEQSELFSSWRIGDIASRQDAVAGIFGELKKFLQVFFIGIYTLAFFALFFTFEALRRMTRRDSGLFVLLGVSKIRLLTFQAIFFSVLFLITFLIAYFTTLSILHFLQNFPLTATMSLSGKDIVLSVSQSFVILFFALMTPARDFMHTTILNLLKKSDITVKRGVPYNLVFSLFGGLLFLLILLGAGPFWIILVCFSSIIFFLFLTLVVRFYFSFIFRLALGLRKKYFLIFYTLRSCVRPGNMTLFMTLPVMIIGIVFFFFLVFSFALLDITRTPESSGRYFILNIEREEKNILEKRFTDIEVYDVLLARMISVNENPIREHLGERTRGGEFTREFNLTTHPLPNNLFTQGEQLQSGGISLDEDFANRLGVSLGDEIGFLLSGREVRYKVQNLRPTLRGDFQAFFYAQLYIDDVAGLDRSYFAVLSDTYLSQETLRAELFGLSPRLQLIDISETLQEVSRILGQVSRGVGAISIYVGIFVTILLSVSLSILAMIRAKESRILSLLGASPVFCRYNLVWEYFVLLSFSFFGAILIGSILSFWFLHSSSFLTFRYIYLLQASFPLMVLAGVLCGSFLFGILLKRTRRDI